MKLAAVVVAVVSLGACSQHLYSPPTQAYSLAPVTTLGPNDKALDIDGSTHSQVFDPGIETGTGRLRTGIGNDAEVSVEGTAARVDDSGPSTARRDFYTGRAGVRVDPGHGPLSWNMGIGGGYSPSAGTFAAIDGGVSIGYDNCYVVPIAAASMFVSQPLAARAVDVTVDSDHPPMYSMPERTGGGTVRGGLRISLSPDTCHAGQQAPWITAGFDMTTLVDATSHAELFGAGVGLTLPL